MFICPQVKTEISVESKHQTLQGLAFPLQPQAQWALQQLRQKTVNYIQLVGARSLSQAHTQGVLHLHPAPAHTHELTSAQPRGNTLPSIPTCSLQSPCVVAALYSLALPGPGSPSGTPVRHCPSIHPPRCIHTSPLGSPLSPEPLPVPDSLCSPLTTPFPQPGSLCPSGPACPLSSRMGPQL